jgi:hypothetical protein
VNECFTSVIALPVCGSMTWDVYVDAIKGKGSERIKTLAPDHRVIAEG